MDNNFDDLLFRAGLCERAEKYNDMAEVMKKTVVALKEEKIASKIKTRNLFSIAFKNLAGARRSSWRILTSELQKIENKEEKRLAIIKEYMKTVENELNEICDDVLNSIDNAVLTNPCYSDPESRVFFLKMKGDYYRYKAEICEDVVSEWEKVSLLSNDNYLQAAEAAKSLKSTNPVKLGLALNYSVYLYEISKDMKKALDVAKDAFDHAIAGLDELSEEHYKDSTLIMQLLRDNMTLWNNYEQTLKVEQEEQSRREMEREDEM
ncbi:hypothetical protein EDEG_03743 [Edhazardia aedis USNM 41457]|uniref:14-3-3 domain-containing protein n=1 Tax=Edhazardia aedis (strain USNM 41457) TaxID=1003232 RepID=J8ZPW9_EDHAE|nr:hypothetical protein EDEG_03743 [Edhazardia aedis USNM 41457]|eukprot:EJW01738.1 hypothetical protein EDEG_03743 [Edhazardia aedis USNM 41457]